MIAVTLQDQYYLFQNLIKYILMNSKLKRQRISDLLIFSLKETYIKSFNVILFNSLLGLKSEKLLDTEEWDADSYFPNNRYFT